MIRYDPYGGEEIYLPYGALLSKYSRSCVCDGYSKLFYQLCCHYEIPCLYVEGYGAENSFTEPYRNHSWNVVKMENGRWYLVDVTWDDTDQGKGSMMHTYFLAGSNSLGYGGMIVQDDHIVHQRETSLGQHKMPVLSKTSYKMPKASLSLSKTRLTIKKGNTFVLKVSKKPASSSNTITFKSSNSRIVKVSSKGQLTAVKKGTATITVRSASGLKAVCQVTVK